MHTSDGWAPRHVCMGVCGCVSMCVCVFLLVVCGS